MYVLLNPNYTILSVNEKLPVSKFRYEKYIDLIQVDSYFYVNVSGQRQTGLKKKQFHEPWNYFAPGALAGCVLMALYLLHTYILLCTIATFQKAGTCLEAQQSMAKQPIKGCVSNHSRMCGESVS